MRVVFARVFRQTLKSSTQKWSFQPAGLVNRLFGGGEENHDVSAIHSQKFFRLVLVISDCESDNSGLDSQAGYHLTQELLCSPAAQGVSYTLCPRPWWVVVCVLWSVVVLVVLNKNSARPLAPAGQLQEYQFLFQEEEGRLLVTRIIYSDLKTVNF